MGNWSCKSCDSDACMDEIPSSFLDGTPTARQICLTLRKIFNPSRRFYGIYEKKEIRLGAVVYLLGKPSRPAIGARYLKGAIACARSLGKDAGYLARWKSPKDRRIQLGKEIRMLERARKLPADDERRSAPQEAPRWNGIRKKGLP